MVLNNISDYLYNRYGEYIAIEKEVNDILTSLYQSPTLYFIIKRFLEVNNFKPTDYYQLQAEFMEEFKTLWYRDSENRFSPEDKDSEGRLLK